MESIASSTSGSALSETYRSRHSDFSSLPKFRSFGQCVFKTQTNYEFLSLFSRRSRVRAITHEVFDGSEGNDLALGNESAFPGLELSPTNNEVVIDELEMIGKEDTVAHFSSDSSSIGRASRAGLFRTPISGGLHSATSVLDLPPPALAVRNLMEQAKFAHLCTVMSRMHHRRAGYPCGSLVDFTVDALGHPIFSLSPLAIHTRNLLADWKCTLVVQIPGWNGLSSARATIFGDAIPLPDDEQGWACQHFISKHQQWASRQWGNFTYFRMDTIRDIYFIGGFGTIQWIDVKVYENTQPDQIVADGGEQILKELNSIFSKALKEILSTEEEIDDVAFISIDSKGTDIRVRQGSQSDIQRLSFQVEHGVQTLEEAKKALHRVINRGCKSRGNYIS